MMKNKLVKVIFLFSFLSYWIFTFIYVMPNNYIRIEAQPIVSFFNIFLYQKWAFFSPPPKSNYRLYYVFEREGRSTTIEVLRAVTKQKKKNAPFNANEEVIDYVLSNSILTIQNKLGTYYHKPAVDASVKDSIVLAKRIEEQLIKLTEYQSLCNYSEIVALKNEIPPGNYTVSFYATHIPIPKFSERHSADTLNKAEGLMFRSQKYQIHKK